jgi:glucose-1-phosphate thymidylyltransferase
VRFGASGYAKELFPLLFEGEGDRLEPRPICELALSAIRAAGADRCITVVSPEKVEVLRVLGQGVEGMALGYVVQPVPRGLPDAICCAAPWIRDLDVVFAMPDTVFLPTMALAEVHARRIASGADVMLGVFPVKEPHRLGPVEIAADGRVVRIHDKPVSTALTNSWGVASWSPRFTAFCVAWEAAREGSSGSSGPEGALGHVFEAARVEGLGVGAVFFDQGQFLDIGTPHGLRAALAALATHGVLVPGQATTARAGPGV